MGFFSRLFGISDKKEEKIESIEDLQPKENLQQILTGNENMCEYCRGPILSTEKYTKQQGHYFHRNCWKQGVKKNNWQGI